MGWRAIHILLLIVLLAGTASAATIHGTIYDIGLEQATNTIIEVNTTPKQLIVAKDSTYSFTLPQGNYLISASHPISGNASEQISVAAEGDYVLDLILFPDLNVGEIENGEFIDVEPVSSTVTTKPIWPWIIAVLALAILVWFIRKKKKPTAEEKPTETEAEEVLAFIKKQGGRTTQKDIRKAMPSSEAKISLIISELQHDGKIKKIKKGRGNIIVLK